MAPQDGTFKRYLEAGMEFTQMTRERAEEIVADLVKQGEVRRKEAAQYVDELVDRSRRNTEELLGIVRREVAEQLRNLGLDDLARRAGGAPARAAADDEDTNAATSARPVPDEAAATVKRVAKKAAKKTATAAAKAKKATKKPS